MSPFGHLYNVPVVIENSLGDSEEIVFNAGSHTETIAMRYHDFAKLLTMKVGTFGQAVAGPATSKKPKAKRPAPRRTASKKISGRSRSRKTTPRARSAAKRRR